MNALLKQIQGWAQTKPDAVALRDAHESLTYAALWARLEHTAEHVRHGPPGPVSLRCDNGIAWILMDLACQWTDRVLLPLPGYFTDAQVQHAQAQAGAAIACEEPIDAAAPWGQVTPLNHPAVALPPGTSKITFTSGSTGQPKGVCLSAAHQIVVAERLNAVIDPNARVHLCCLPLPTLLENIGGVYVPLWRGGTVVALPQIDLGFHGSRLINLSALLQQITVHEPHSLILVPQLLSLLTRAVASGWQPPASLTFLAVGGSRVAPALIERARALGLPVYEGYGLSECGSVVSLNTPGADRPGSAGRVLPGVTVSLDTDGRIRVSGSAFLGYIGDPDTAGQDEVDTGDLGWFDGDQFLHLQGRHKNLLINSYGRNISPEWVESSVLAEPQILECWVFGDARPACHAFIYAPELSDDAVDHALQRTLQDLPDYAQIAHWDRLDTPLAAHPAFMTANGRPRRDRMAQHLAARLEAAYSTTDWNTEETKP